MDSECEMCGGNINLPEDAIVGELVTCPDCGLDFELYANASGTFMLKSAEEVKEDWGE